MALIVFFAYVSRTVINIDEKYFSVDSFCIHFIRKSTIKKLEWFHFYDFFPETFADKTHFLLANVTEQTLSLHIEVLF